MPAAANEADSNLRDQAYGYICQQFVDGRLQAGSRLSVGALAKEIGISRTPVAEALLRLRMENVVEQTPRVGTIVRRPGVQEVVELYELRRLVESYAAEQAALHCSARDLALLDRLLQKMRGVCLELRQRGAPSHSHDVMRRHLSTDMAFHMVILRGVQNRWMIKAVENARAFLMIFCARRHEQHTLKTLADIYLWHGRIRNAIRRRDPVAARELMDRHIQEGCEGAVAYLSQHQDESGFDLDFDIQSLIPPGRGFPNHKADRDKDRRG